MSRSAWLAITAMVVGLLPLWLAALRLVSLCH